MQTHIAGRRIAWIGLLFLLSGLLSCAALPPGTARTGQFLSGRLLHVTMVFRGAIDPNNYYYFVINNSSSNPKNAPGPIAILPNEGGNGWGNGFAAGSNGSVNGFTDFVLFNITTPSSQGYEIYHVGGDGNVNNRANFKPSGQPIQVTPVQGGATLDFWIDLAQLFVDANGQPLSNATGAVAAAVQNLQYLQVNMIATNIVPADQATGAIEKQVDSLGDTRTAAGATSFLVMDMSQSAAVYSNQKSASLLIQEPSDTDVVGSGNPLQSLDLIDWTVSIENNKNL